MRTENSHYVLRRYVDAGAEFHRGDIRFIQAIRALYYQDKKIAELGPHECSVRLINLQGLPPDKILKYLRVLSLDIRKYKDNVWLKVPCIETLFLVPPEGICKLQGRYLN